MEEDKLNIKAELAERKSSVESLKEDLRKSEDKLGQVSQEKNQMEQRLKTEEETREKVLRSL